MSRFLVPKFQTLEAYTPGEQPKIGEFLKLNTNESPFPPSPKAAAMVAEKVANSNIYNDNRCLALTDAFAQRYGIDPDQVIFSNGSDEILAFCFLAFCDEKTGIAFPEISYGFYQVFAQLFSIEPEQIPLKSDFSVDITDYFKKKKTIVIANPNAPTAMALTASQVAEILENNPENVVIIDEAYVDFGGESAIGLTATYPNLVVTGTFSKSRSMAGARLGYAVASPDLIADLNRIKYSFNPYNVNTLTQVLGCVSLAEQDYYEECIATVKAARTQFVADLNRLGFKTLPSCANFVFTRHSALSGDELYQGLRQKKILVRHFTNPKIREFVRISIGTPDQMTQVAEALAELLEVPHA